MIIFKGTSQTNETQQIDLLKRQSDTEARQEFATHMAHQQPSSLSQSLQRKDLSTSEQNQTFLDKAKEALLFQRLGVDKEKIDELKAKLEELAQMLADGKISEKEFEQQQALIQEQLAEEYKKGQQRAQSTEREKAQNDKFEQ